MDRLATEIGSRPSGSQAQQEAARYILDQFAQMGYDAVLQPYTFSHFQERQVELLLKQPVAMEIVARVMVYSGGGSVEGQMVPCGLGRAQDIPLAGIQGKVALMQRGGGISFQEKVSTVAARGAAAAVIYNDRTGEFRGALSSQATIPVVGILEQDGERLLEQLRREPVVVSLRVDAGTDNLQGHNVVATGKGASTMRQVVVVGAHYDSVPAGPGANDNASGVGTMLELARATRQLNLPFDLVFVAFGDEEIGLIGSKRYVEMLAAQERQRILAMLNLDMVGVGTRMEFGGDPVLSDLAQRAAIQMGYRASGLGVKLAGASDHASFLAAGIPAVFFHRVDDPNYHTELDTAEKVAPEYLEAAGRVALRLLEMLARES